jgi:hypothetical protein
MGVKVRFLEAGPEPAEGRPPGVLVPTRALRERDGTSFLFIAADGVAQRRDVEVAGASGNEARIAAGVSAGERVIVDPSPEIVDGVAVQARQGK